MLFCSCFRHGYFETLTLFELISQAAKLIVRGGISIVFLGGFCEILPPTVSKSSKYFIFSMNFGWFGVDLEKLLIIALESKDSLSSLCLCLSVPQSFSLSFYTCLGWVFRQM